MPSSTRVVRIKGSDVDGVERGILVDTDGAILTRKAGAATIHNWFPDGAISSNALIDLAGDGDYDTKLWYGSQGSETLTYRAVNGDVPAAVIVALPGQSWAEGLYGADWSQRWSEPLPSGRYRIGFDVEVTDGDSLILRATPVINLSAAASYCDTPVLVTGTRQRHMLDVYLQTATFLGMAVFVSPHDYALGGGSIGEGVTIPTSTFAVSLVEVTEGDPMAFADGDSDGWSWAGTPHASPSSGPQL